MQVASVHVIGKLLLPKVTAGGCNLAFKNAIFISMKNAPIFSFFATNVIRGWYHHPLRVHFWKIKFCNGRCLINVNDSIFVATLLLCFNSILSTKDTFWNILLTVLLDLYLPFILSPKPTIVSQIGRYSSMAAVCMLYLFTTKLPVACCRCTCSAKLLALLAHFIFWLTMESPFNPIDGSDTYWYYITKTRWMNTLGTFYGSANNCQLYVKNCMHSESRPIAMFENMQVVYRTFNHVQWNYEVTNIPMDRNY